MALSSLADLLMSYRLEKEDAEKRLKDANESIRRVEVEIFAEMQASEIEKFGHAGKIFFPRVESHPTVNKDLEAAFIEWLRERHEEGIYKLSAHPSTLKGWYKQNADKYAEELSEKGFIKVFEEIRISVRAA